MRLLSLLTISTALMLALYSCDRDPGPTMSSDPQSPSITAPEEGGQTFELDEGLADEELFMMEWSAADFGYNAALEYHVQLSEVGDNFEDYATIGSTNDTQMSITGGDVNSALLSLGFTDDMEVEAQIRVAAEVDDADVDMVYSDALIFNFVPFMEEIELPEIYVPGSYQDVSGYTADWSPEDAPPLFSPDDDGVYEGYVYMAEADNMFKFTPERNWDNDWGVDPDGGEADLIGEGEGDDIELDDPGYYRFIVDTEELVFEYEDTEWGIIGEAVGGWEEGDDVMMEYDMEDHVWIHEDVDLEADEMKFRANEAWDLDYGDDEGNFELDQGGENIQVEQAGNYTVILDLGEYPFSYELIMN